MGKVHTGENLVDALTKRLPAEITYLGIGYELVLRASTSKNSNDKDSGRRTDMFFFLLKFFLRLPYVS